MIRIRNFILFIVSVLYFLPISVSAHVKWFVEEPVSLVKSFSLSDGPVIIWIALLAVIVFVAYLLERKLKSNRLTQYLEEGSDYFLSIANIGIGLSLIIFSISGFVFAPNLTPYGSFGGILLAVQALVGLFFLLGLFTRWASGLLMLLWGCVLVHFGEVEMIETIEFLGIGLYGLTIGRPRWRIAESQVLLRAVKSLKPYGIPFLRVFAGINLVALGFSEKLLRPDLAMTFLERHQWNFMSMLGMDKFTDYWFVLSAGFAEIIFGVLLIFGLVTRLTVLALACFLVVTFIVMGPTELIGHLPHFSLAIVLIALGSGNKLKLR